MYNIVMIKKILCICLIYFLFPHFVLAESIKGGIEQTDIKEQIDKKLFTGEVDVLDEKDTIKMTVSQVLNGSYTEIGDEFFAEITEDVLGGKRKKGIIVPKGSIIHGVVTTVEDPKNLGRNGYIVTVFDYLVTPDGRQIPINASLSTKENVVKGTAKNVVKHVGVTATGGVVGTLFAMNLLGLEAAIASNGMTLAGGAAVGGAVGLVSSLMNKGKNVNIKPGDELKIKMVTDLQIPVMSKEAFREDDLLFYAFDIALMNEIKNVYYPSPFGDTSLWFKKIEPGDVVLGKLSFTIGNKKYKHWLVFYDRATRKPIAKYSIENIIADNKVNKSKKEKKNKKVWN